MATSKVDTLEIKGATKVKAAAKPITHFLAALILKFLATNLSEHQPPRILERPNAKKGIQNNSPMRSKDKSRSWFRYLGTQNIKK